MKEQSSRFQKKYRTDERFDQSASWESIKYDLQLELALPKWFTVL